jgi:HK97 family phage major capsid protein
MKTLSEQIKDLQESIGETKNKLVEATKQLQETPDDATEGAVVELTAALEKDNARLESLLKAEKALGTVATAVANPAPGVLKTGQTNSKIADNLLGKLAILSYESRVKGMSVESVAHGRFGADAEIILEVSKAVQNPALSNVTAYAGELTDSAILALLDTLRATAILPKCTPLAKQHIFQGNTALKVPFRSGSSTQAAAAFRAEGAPIPVGGLTFSSLSLTPKNMGVILTATEEMLSRSTISLAAYMQSAIVEDTAEALDTIFMDATAGSTTRPAGVRNGVAGGDTRAAAGTGTTADKITDIKACVSAMATAKMGKAPVWIMGVNNWLAVSMALTATGALQFPETAQGKLAGFPVVVSQAAPSDVVLLVDFAEYSFALGNPNFLASNVATIHEETVPLALSAVATPNTVAAPIRSLFQTNSWALRMMLDADWSKLRTGGMVQQLTSVAWL